MLAGLRWLLACAGAGVLIAVSWHNESLYLWLWLGLAWFFWTATHTRRPFLFGLMSGGLALSIAFYWTPAALANTIVLPPWTVWLLIAGLIVWESLPFGLIAWIASRHLAGPQDQWRWYHGWLIPVTWVSLEVFWPRIFPWSFAHSQTAFPTLLQIAEWGGAPTVSLVILGVALIPSVWSAGRGDSDNRSNRRPVSHAVWGYCIGWTSLLLGVLLFGQQRWHQWTERAKELPSVRTALVQVDPRHQESIRKMRMRTMQSGSSLDLVVWPESTLGTYSNELDSFGDEQRTRRESVLPRVDLHPSRSLSCELLAGGKSYAPGRGRTGPFRQTAYLVRPDETIAGRYIKRSLMPIGEYIPGQETFPWLRAWVELSEPIVTGNDPRPVRLRDGTRLGVLMCYEDMVSENARDTVVAGAEILLCLINGSAFENPLTLEQHLRLAQLRAVENRRAFARCAATGVSCVISPTGQILERAKPQTEATLVADLPRNQTLTVYSRFGYLFPYACLLGTAYLVCASLLAARVRRPVSSPDSTCCDVTRVD